MYFPHDFYIGGALERYGEYGEQELDLLLSYVKEGDVIVEAGANIGCDTVPLARKVTNSGRIFAFEPQRIIYQMLCGNLAMNALWNVAAERAALGDEDGIMQVPPVDYSRTGNFGGVALGKDGAEPVPVIKLDQLQLSRCALIKADVEGMELAVLKGASDTIARLRPILYVENDREDKAVELVTHLQSIGYRVYFHNPPLFNPQNFRRNERDEYQQDGKAICSLNLLCLPDDSRGVPKGLTLVGGVRR